MKLVNFHPRHCGNPGHRGFTLAEMLIAVTIFLVLVGGILSANLFGLQIYQMTTTKLNVTQWSRETIMQLADEIHVCTSAQVGMVSNGVFSAFLDGETEQGNALFINPTSDTNIYIIYFLNTDDLTFRRTDESNNTVILASSVTNTLPFSAQDFSGNVLTNGSTSQVIHVDLEIRQPQFFMQSADYYKLETSIKPRVVP